MTDPFSLATGAVSIIGFGGQVAQGIQFLYGIFKDIKDFPESLRDFKSTLELLEIILKQLESKQLLPPPDNENAVRSAYQQCEERVQLLQRLLQKYQVKKGQGGVKKKWKRVLGGLKIADVEKHARRIEDAKSSLLAALKM